jgi:hypothetical protein
MTRHLTRAAATAAALAALAAPAASADSTPVGKLPKADVTTLTTKKGALFSIAVPTQLPPTGLVWRVARPFKTKVVSQVGEGDVSGATVLVFRAVGRGKATIVLALTKGDSSPKALAAVRYAITAR